MRVPTEVNEILQQISEPGLRTALKLLFAQQAIQHEQNQMALSQMRKTFTGAFVDDDPAGHRAYHQALVDRIMLRNQVLREMLVALGKWGGAGIVGFLIYKLFGIKIPLP